MSKKLIEMIAPRNKVEDIIPLLGLHFSFQRMLDRQISRDMDFSCSKITKGGFYCETFKDIAYLLTIGMLNYGYFYIASDFLSNRI